MNIKRFEEFLLESVNDKHIFKAVFVVGGPGSGKSTISKEMFAGTEFRSVDSDKVVEYLFKKHGISMKYDKSKEAEYTRQMDTRNAAMSMTFRNMDKLINGMLPLIVDGTGKHVEKVANQKKALESVGYDCYLLFVNTSLEVAIERDAKRDRSLGEDETTRQWKKVQSNLDKFSNMFDHDGFFIVKGEKNNKDNDRAANKILNAQLKNPIGKWIMSQLKQNHGKYLSDLKAPIPSVEELSHPGRWASASASSASS